MPNLVAGPVKQYGTYNRMLGMENILRAVNVSGNVRSYQLKVKENQKQGKLTTKTIDIAAYNIFACNINNYPEYATLPDSYGVFSLKAKASRQIGAQLLRLREINGEVDFAINTVIQ